MYNIFRLFKLSTDIKMEFYDNILLLTVYYTKSHSNYYRQVDRMAHLSDSATEINANTGIG